MSDAALEYGWDNPQDDVIRKRAKRITEFERGRSGRKHDAYGLCAKCRHFVARTRSDGAYMETQAYCNELPEMFEVLTTQKPVTDCGAFWPVGAPTLREMLGEAKMLEKRDGVKGYL